MMTLQLSFLFPFEDTQLHSADKHTANTSIITNTFISHIIIVLMTD